MDPRTITRSVRIDAGPDAVWTAVGDADGLGSWLGAAVDVEVVPGAVGAFVDHDGTARRLVVTEVAEGDRLGFVWWDHDRPDDTSSVTITVRPDGDGSVVTVTETVDAVALAAGGGIGGRVATVAPAGLEHLEARWDDRLAGLADRLAPALVGVGA